MEQGKGKSHKFPGPRNPNPPYQDGGNNGHMTYITPAQQLAQWKAFLRADIERENAREWWETYIAEKADADTVTWSDADVFASKLHERTHGARKKRW